MSCRVWKGLLEDYLKIRFMARMVSTSKDMKLKRCMWN